MLRSVIPQFEGPLSVGHGGVGPGPVPVNVELILDFADLVPGYIEPPKIDLGDLDVCNASGCPRGTINWEYVIEASREVGVVSDTLAIKEAAKSLGDLEIQEAMFTVIFDPEDSELDEVIPGNWPTTGEPSREWLLADTVEEAGLEFVHTTVPTDALIEAMPRLFEAGATIAFGPAQDGRLDERVEELGLQADFYVIDGLDF